MKLRTPPTLRNRLTIVVALRCPVLLAVLIAVFNLVLGAEIRGALDGRLRARASAALANVVIRRGGLVVREAPRDEAIDRQLWVFAGRRAVEAPAGDAPDINAA